MNDQELLAERFEEHRTYLHMGAVVEIDGRRIVTQALTITNGKITTMDVFLEPMIPDRP